jgi:hypothetical protein
MLFDIAEAPNADHVAARSPMVESPQRCAVSPKDVNEALRGRSVCNVAQAERLCSGREDSRFEAAHVSAEDAVKVELLLERIPWPEVASCRGCVYADAVR